MNINETPRPSDGEPRPTTLAQWRIQIIQDILSSGLKSSEIIYREGRAIPGSGEGFLLAQIQGCVLYPQYDYDNTERFVRHIQNELYFGGYSVLPVVMERLEDGEESLTVRDIDSLEQRAQSSFIVVCKKSDERLPQVAKRSVVPQEAFSYIIYPDIILPLVQSIENSFQGTPIKLAEGFIERRVDERLGFPILKIPNYEDPIVEILTELEEPIWIHGVRLPTQEDFEKFMPAPR